MPFEILFEPAACNFFKSYRVYSDVVLAEPPPAGLSIDERVPPTACSSAR